jgi:signal peptidase I
MRQPNSVQVLRDYGLTIALATVLALGIRSFVFEAYRIPSSSMRPTLDAGDTAFVAKWPYGLTLPLSIGKMTQGRAPLYGEIVVASFPDELGREWVKRVVGLPGDQIQIQEGRIVLNGRLSDFRPSQDALCGEERVHTNRGSFHFPICLEPPVWEFRQTLEVGPDEVFVVGDQRGGTPLDLKRQKSFGVVPRSLLKGKAVAVWLSIQPRTALDSGDWFSRIRFDRILKPIR